MPNPMATDLTPLDCPDVADCLRDGPLPDAATVPVGVKAAWTDCAAWTVRAGENPKFADWEVAYLAGGKWHGVTLRDVKHWLPLPPWNGEVE